MSELCGSLIKTTLLDFPGRVACAIFLPTCNLRCPYCYNAELVVEDSKSKTQFCTLGDLIAHLEKRKNVISAFVISGGEPLLNPLTPNLIRTAKSFGYKIKIDTNGTLPDLLEKIILNSEIRPDFIAMDIKTSPEKYGEKLFEKNSLPKDFSSVLFRSIKIIEKNYSAKNCEWRTVLVPPLVTHSDIEKIAKMLPKWASWQFAHFQNSQTLNPEYQKIAPYTQAQENALVEFARQKIPSANLR